MPLVAAALGFVLYLPSVAGTFLYDDIKIVVENEAIRDLTELGTVLRADPTRPLLSLSLALNYAFAALEPWPYHLTGVVIHAVNSLLVAFLFLWMVRRAGRDERIALIGACLFAATPMAAETVAYVASRSTALVSLFVLASLNVAARSLTEPRPRRLALAVALFVLAIASKEEAASLPLYLLLLDYFFVASGRFRDVISRWRIHAVFLALPLAGLVARRAVSGAWLPATPIGLERYLLTQWAALPGYLVRAALPFDPAFYRRSAVASWPPELSFVVWGVLATGLVVAAFRFRRRTPYAALAVAWLVAGLLPSSSLAPLKEMVVDHRVYLASAGTHFALAALLVRVPRRATLALLIVLSLVTLRYEWILGDPVRAWRDAVRRAPRSAEAHRALGDELAARGDTDAAQESLRNAVELEPSDPEMWTNLGSFYLNVSRFDAAAAAFVEAARLRPRNAYLRDNLGILYLHLNRVEDAVREFEAAAAGEPPLAQPRIALAEVLTQRGELARATRLLDEAARLGIDAADARRIARVRDLIRDQTP